MEGRRRIVVDGGIDGFSVAFDSSYVKGIAISHDKEYAEIVFKDGTNTFVTIDPNKYEIKRHQDEVD